MTLLLLIASLSLVITLVRRKYYFSATMFLLISVYDLSVLLAYRFQLYEQTISLPRLIPGLTAEIISGFETGYLLFLISLSMTFASASLLISRKYRYSVATSPSERSTKFVAVAIASAFGSVSLLEGGGDSRLLQYTTDFEFDLIAVTPFHFYAATLAPLAWFYMVKDYFDNNKLSALIIFFALLPLMIDFFTSGRRQVFAPLVFLVIFFILIEPRFNLVRKFFSCLGIGLGVLAMFAVQFGLRYQIMATSRGGADVSMWDYTEDIFAPQFGEFVAVGATGVAAFRDFIYSGYEPLGVFAFIDFLLLNFPVIRNLIESGLFGNADMVRIAISSVAPYGALSYHAEFILFFGLLGFVISGFVIGVFLVICERRLLLPILFNKLRKFDFLDAVAISLVAALFFKYRSGFSDNVGLVIRFFVLAALIYVFSYAITRIRPRG